MEWLAILKKTHHWTKSSKSKYPDPAHDEITVTESDMNLIREKLSRRANSSTDPTAIPLNFSMTLQPHGTVGSDQQINGGRMVGNPQTDELLKLLEIDHIITVPYLFSTAQTHHGNSKLDGNDGVAEDTNEIDLDDVDEDTNEEMKESRASKLEEPQEDADEIDLDDI